MCGLGGGSAVIVGWEGMDDDVACVGKLLTRGRPLTSTI